MLQAANSIHSQHFAIWPAKRSILERAVCHLGACSDNNADFLIGIHYFHIPMIHLVYPQRCCIFSKFSWDILQSSQENLGDKRGVLWLM